MSTDERENGDDESASNSWSAVLAAVESDMRRTEQMLATPTHQPPAADAGLAPAQATLPSPFRQYAAVAWAELPAPDDMPPVPPEMVERIHVLRVQIVALQAEIKSEMALWRASSAANRPSTPPALNSEPFFVDRLA
jgi:hypothetical protein